MAGRLVRQHTKYLYARYREKRGIIASRVVKLSFTMEEAAAYFDNLHMAGDKAEFYVCGLCGRIHMTSGRNKP